MRAASGPVSAGGRADWVAVDWGTSRMRAYAIGPDDTVLHALPGGPGMGALAPDGFERVLTDALAPLLRDRGAADPLEVLVCGMAGARQGWREAPYVPVPARLDGLLAHAVTPPLSDARLSVRIVPGLSQAPDPARGTGADVMRGEETQIIGLVAREGLEGATVCMPGTHAKWVTLAEGRVERFSTHMTGELHALLSTRSILRHSVGEDTPAPDARAFEAAVAEALAARGAVLDRLFGLRAGDLLAVPGTERPGFAAARLSGLLIGAEIAVATRPGGSGATGAPADAEVGGDRSPDAVHVVGAGALADLYVRALEIAGRTAVGHDGADLAVAGLARLRAARGMVARRDGEMGRPGE